MPHAAEFTCAECGALAGRVEVVPSPTAGRHRLVLSIFFSMWQEMPEDGRYARAIAAIDAHDARTLWQGWFEWAPFFCPECDACYCRDHWRMEMDLDEGFFDCTWGTCPRGHRRMIED
ncbi:hypothetical protein [Longimicrobium sp.]|uniref:hypothetical protein n=1 Tax=Longimicrobium sp. TaxID=2029185 RepID=UPI002BEB6464|nr:hypothetical protein [Longimicrobium sp.]HSU16718.1 hypothetical protein [Longimicrobium sp.]